MSELNAIPLIFDALRVITVGGIFKLFVWDMFIKDYYDAGMQNLDKTAACCRQAKLNDEKNNNISENRTGDDKLSGDRHRGVEDTDV